jgi:hypothetical protein
MCMARNARWAIFNHVFEILVMSRERSWHAEHDNGPVVLEPMHGPGRHRLQIMILPNAVCQNSALVSRPLAPDAKDKAALL